MSQTKKAIQILIVDDEKIIQASIKKTLKDEDFELLFANNGKEALELLKHNKPVVLIVDLNMPEMDGITFLKKIDLKPDDEYAVIILTGHGNDKLMQECYDLGASLFMHKPFTMVELQCHIHQLIRTKSLEKEKLNLIKKLQKSLKEIKTLQGIIPICSYCHKIQDDEGYWNRIEKYISEHSEAKLSHGICKECFNKLHPGWEGKHGDY